jgi:hypothetical protein
MEAKLMDDREWEYLAFVETECYLDPALGWRFEACARELDKRNGYDPDGGIDLELPPGDQHYPEGY